MRAHELPLGEDFLDAVSVDVFADADGLVDSTKLTEVFKGGVHLLVGDDG